ncbi:MAG: SDR family NAD(P)-dependent oxidoreductase [Proteobacteria bacterium]|nr:SDR family NAD(P)-dependent oxidoreductase [Pseudomonadota bacterium]
MSGFDFQERLVLVTGGARGIGLHLTHQLVERGARVLMVGRDLNALEKARNEHGDRVFIHAADLAHPDAAVELARWVAREHPDCSALINNAAIMIHEDLTKDGDLHAAAISTEIGINLTAPIQLAAALLPVLAKHEKSLIANVTSGLAIAPKRDAAVYCATKAGMRSFTRSLRDQCRKAGLGVQVSEVVMTLVDTTLSSAANAMKKYPPSFAAADMLAGIEKGQDEVWIEKTKILRLLHRLAPSLAYRIMRGR